MKPKLLSTTMLFIAIMFLSIASTHAQKQTPAQKPKPPLQQDESAAAKTVNSVAEKYFSDVELINQDGQKMRFYSDVLKDKVVIINSFSTTCTGVCPPMNRNLERVQEALGDRLGKEAFLV